MECALAHLELRPPRIGRASPLQAFVGFTCSVDHSIIYLGEPVWLVEEADRGQEKKTGVIAGDRIAALHKYPSLEGVWQDMDRNSRLRTVAVWVWRPHPRNMRADCRHNWALAQHDMSLWRTGRNVTNTISLGYFLHLLPQVPLYELDALRYFELRRDDIAATLDRQDGGSATTISLATFREDGGSATTLPLPRSLETLPQWAQEDSWRYRLRYRLGGGPSRGLPDARD